ncbi:MAG: UDP-N-acetylmuramate dehydrogenase [Phycisphaerae bacterium]
MDWLSGFANRTARDAALAPRTWYRLGGPAAYLVRPTDPTDLAELVRRAADTRVEVRILGAGANVLVRDAGVDGIVILLDAPAFRTVRVDGTCVEAGAGVDLMPLVRACCARGLSGLECMAGIPGTVGGAVRMNAGGPAGTFGDVVDTIDVLSRTGVRETWPAERIRFGYRTSAVGDCIVLSARLRLCQAHPETVRDRYDAAFAQKRRTQPLADKSAGCVFKNPPGASAGALIDHAGLKGVAYGGASVSTRHANFIVADRGATASDVLNLMDLIRDRVRRVHGTELETELDIW